MGLQCVSSIGLRSGSSVGLQSGSGTGRNLNPIKPRGPGTWIQHLKGMNPAFEIRGVFFMNRTDSACFRNRCAANRRATPQIAIAVALLVVCQVQLCPVCVFGQAVALASSAPDATALTSSAPDAAAQEEAGQDAAYQLVWKDELTYRLLGSDFARVELELYRSADGTAKYVDRTHYEAQATEVVTEWILDETSPLPVFKDYSFSLSAPGVNLDVAISWGDSPGDRVTYEVEQTGTRGTFSTREADPATALGSGPRLMIVPLDNNAIADYLVPTWFLPSQQAGESGKFGLVLPVSLPQHSLVLETTLEYLGVDESLGKPSLKYRVSAGGVSILVWTTPEERRLLKLEIASQGVEIVNEALLADWARVVDSAQPTGKARLAGEVARVAETESAERGGETVPAGPAGVGEAEPANIVEREVEVPARGGNLAATLSLPADAPGEVPGVVIVAGSGPTDRDGNNPLIPGEVNTYKEIAHYLSSRGIAVLRYDKRGIAGSAALMGAETPSFSQYAEDVKSCVEFLKSVDGVRSDRVFIAGHSEGGILALMAASAGTDAPSGKDASSSADASLATDACQGTGARIGTDVAGLILLATPGYPAEHILRLQIGAQADALESMGITGIKEKMLAALDGLYEAIRTDTPFDYSTYGLPDEYAAIYLSLDYQREFAKGFLFVDPAELAQQIEVPVCIIQGTVDTQVGVDNAYTLAAALEDKNAELHIVEGADHVLKPTEGEPLPYGDPSRHVSSEVLKAIEGFVSK